MTVQIPNEVGTTLAGTPSPASIATESSDSVAQAGLADHVQQVSIVGMMAEIKYMLSLLAKTFSGAFQNDPSTLASRGSVLRAQIEDFRNEPNFTQTWPFICYCSGFSSLYNPAGGTQPGFRAGTASGFDGQAESFIPSLMLTSWHKTVNRWITRT